MGCNGCSTRTLGGLPGGCKNNGACKTGGCGKLDVYDWLSNVYYHDEVVEHSIVELKFKGTRKEYYRNVNNEDIEIGDALVVESATTGWDLGYVSLTGELVKLQLKKYKINENGDQIRRVIREADFDKFDEGKGLEQETMIKARILAMQQGLSMKISDVEYQGDRTKATFFYTAEGRVDFRELIKVLAREFRIKIEMRQIGLRQEAGRLGGIGSCGRELCCSTWLTDFHSVPTTAARYQNLFLNPLKLSGQCGRLKCCLNYELDQYVEALKSFPDEHTTIKTEKGVARADKIDILKGLMFFRYEGDPTGRLFPLEIEKVHLLLEMNEKGIAPSEIEEYQVEDENEVEEIQFRDTVGEESLDRFDARRKNKKKKKRGGSQGGDRGPQAGAGQRPPQGGGTGQAQPQQRQANPQPQQGPRQNQSDNRPQNPNQGNRPQGQNPNQQQGQGNRPQNQNPNQQRGERQPNPNQGNRQQNPGNRGQNQNPNQQQGGQGNRGQNPNQGNRQPNPNQQQGPKPQNPNQGNAPRNARPETGGDKENNNNRPQGNNDRNRNNSRGRRNRPDGNKPDGPADNGPKPENN